MKSPPDSGCRHPMVPASSRVSSYPQGAQGIRPRLDVERLARAPSRPGVLTRMAPRWRTWGMMPWPMPAAAGNCDPPPELWPELGKGERRLRRHWLPCMPASMAVESGGSASSGAGRDAGTPAPLQIPFTRAAHVGAELAMAETPTPAAGQLVGGEGAQHGFSRMGLNHGLAPLVPSSFCNASRRRDLMVPSGTPSRSASSCWELLQIDAAHHLLLRPGRWRHSGPSGGSAPRPTPLRCLLRPGTPAGASPRRRDLLAGAAAAQHVKAWLRITYRSRWSAPLVG